MSVEIKPLGELELWNRPGAGHVAPWVVGSVVVAAFLSVVIAGAAAWTLWRIGGSSELYDRTWFQGLPPFAMAAALTVVFVPDGSVSRFMRLAVLLPVLHAIALVFALFHIPGLEMPELEQRTPMLASLPVEALFFGGLAIMLALARVLGGRREWAHAFVMLALANVLLFGLWLPVFAQLASITGRTDYGWYETFTPTLERLRDPGWLPVLAFGPPLLLASLYTLLAIRAPRWTRRLRAWVVAAVIWLFGGALLARYRSDHGSFLVHDNFMHGLLAAAALAIVGTSTLAISTWLIGRRELRRLATEPHRKQAVIDDEDGEVIACMQITSWLRGPRMWMRSFIASANGELVRVPSGACLATAVPRISSALRTGEAVVVIGRRDPVVLGGFVEREVGESPFRSVTMTVPGPSGILVGRDEPVSTPIESMLLTAWRPSVAYLLIMLAIAVPSLLGLVVDSSGR